MFQKCFVANKYINDGAFDWKIRGYVEKVHKQLMPPPGDDEKDQPNSGLPVCSSPVINNIPTFENFTTKNLKSCIFLFYYLTQPR